MRLAKENPNSIANKLEKRTLQSQLQRFLDGYTKEPKRSTLLPVAEHYGISVEAFFNEELAERLLKQIETGEFIVKRHRAIYRALPAATAPDEGMADKPPISAALGIDAIAQALTLMTDAQRETMAGKLAALARAPDSPTLKKSISESLGSATSKPPDPE